MRRRRLRRPDFLKWAAALGCGRRDGTGPPPPASTVLRIALARDGLRPPLTPETSGGPQGQQKRAAHRAAPVGPRRPPARTRRPLGPCTGVPGRRDTGTRQPPPDTSGHLFNYVNKQKNYKADRRSAAKLSLNQSRGAPDITRGWCRIMGLAPRLLFTTCLTITRNQRITAAWDRRQEDNARRAAAGLPRGPTAGAANHLPPSPQHRHNPHPAPLTTTNTPARQHWHAREQAPRTQRDTAMSSAMSMGPPAEGCCHGDGTTWFAS